MLCVTVPGCSIERASSSRSSDNRSGASDRTMARKRRTGGQKASSDGMGAVDAPAWHVPVSC
jgi:hypothetical protein